MSPKTKTLQDWLAYIAEAQAKKSQQREILATRLTANQKRIEEPALPDINTYVQAEMEIPVLIRLLAEHDRISPSEWDAKEGDLIVFANAPEIVALLRSTLTERTKNKDSFFAAIGKRVSTLAIDLFAPERDRDAIRKRIEAAEAEAENLEFAIASAVTAIRRLEIEPSLATFGAANARVHEIYISVSSSGS